MDKINLSSNQKQIVEAPLGPILVLATAGSGKTRVLTQRVRHLLQQNPHDGVLALTFTNKAADELTERLAGVEDVENRTFVGTIHSFAQTIIEKHGRHIGIEKTPHIFERDEDRICILVEAIEAFSDGVHETPTPYGEASKQERAYLIEWLSRISQFKREMLTDDQIEESNPDNSTLEIFREYNALLRQQNGVDFDDLLVLACRILSEVPSVAGMYARNYSHVCIDEAQDLNNAQYQLIRALCLNRVNSIMMVGDPNQAIYGFNGSSPDFMKERFVSDFHPKIFNLKENYRSTKTVLQLAVLLKPGSHEIQQAALEGRSEYYAANDEADEARWICEQIYSLMNLKTHPEIEGVISFANMVVLARNRFVFKELQTRLDERNWPWYLKKSPGAPVFESPLGQIVDLVLRVILNPQDTLHYGELNGLVTNGAQSTLTAEQMLDYWEQLNGETLQGAHAYLPEVIRLLRKENQSSSPDLEAPLNLIHQKLLNDMIDDDESELTLNNINDLNDLKAHWRRYVQSLPSAASLSLSAFKNAMAMGKTHQESIPKGLALSTVHTMKGLEKDIVFLMGMGQGTFPDYRAVEGGGSRMREELNNAYVAVTRARRFIYVSYPRTKLMPWGDTRPQRPSEFLKRMKLVQE